MVKLSDMVLNHQVRLVCAVLRITKCVLSPACGDTLQIAHLVLVEQIYRAWTILRGEPYHH